MDERNFVEKMLMKGDALRPQYRDFDFSKLDKTQIFWLDKLSWFSRFRKRIINRFNGTAITSDAKIVFLDQHSMTIGTSVFYTLEHQRQVYLRASENYLMIAPLVSLGFFLAYALRVPVHQKLYKELAKSVVLGSTLSYSFVYYHYLNYIEVVDSCYELVKQKFKKDKRLQALSENDDVRKLTVKNFGFSPWRDGDVDTEDDIDEFNQYIFEGTAEDETQERKEEMFMKIYGS
uniref:Uncharacterized protein n=1 Tax=Strombidium rassoulzadegani TaxID=1082188 RepID=A0A7S3CK52_9SPIT